MRFPIKSAPTPVLRRLCIGLALLLAMVMGSTLFVACSVKQDLEQLHQRVISRQNQVPPSAAEIITAIDHPAFGTAGPVNCTIRAVVRGFRDRLRHGSRVHICRHTICHPRVPEQVAMRFLESRTSDPVPVWQWLLVSEVAYRAVSPEILVDLYSHYYFDDRSLSESAMSHTGRQLSELSEAELLWVLAREETAESCRANENPDLVHFPGDPTCEDYVRMSCETLQSYLAAGRELREFLGHRF
ncbi:MAG: hypothetical protein GY856_18025 [bacterium]|nr:hypothetical protein [bacterium]